MSVSKRLSEFFDAKKISQTDVADILNVKRQTIGAILHDRQKLTLDQLIALMKHFPDLNSTWLLIGKGDMNIGENSSAAAEPMEMYAIKNSLETRIEKLVSLVELILYPNFALKR